MSWLRGLISVSCHCETFRVTLSRVSLLLGYPYSLARVSWTLEQEQSSDYVII